MKTKLKKPKTIYELSKEVRKFWLINPVTRIKKNELKNKKKRRKAVKKQVENYLNK